jgi:hypothetical protein
MPSDGFFAAAQRALSLGSTAQLGEMLGISRRTAQRFISSGVPRYHKRELARLVLAFDPQLAAAIAQSEDHSLATWGLVKVEPEVVVQPAPPPPPPAPPPPPPDGVVDAVVCAAAEGMQMMPGDVRAGLLAAFTKARAIGVDVAQVERVLRATLAPPTTGATVQPGPTARTSKRSA